MLIVVAGLIEAEGKILVCQRRRGDTFELKWEFPGGKLQAGEMAAQGLARELLEELGVEARVGEEVFRTRHRYAEMSEEIELIFFAAIVDAHAVRNIVFETMQWRAPETLGELNFLPADREFVGKLARREIAAASTAAGIGADGGKRDPSLRSGGRCLSLRQKTEGEEHSHGRPFHDDGCD
jgi:8-oxo-dGTP diphosphatase